MLEGGEGRAIWWVQGFLMGGGGGGGEGRFSGGLYSKEMRDNKRMIYIHENLFNYHRYNHCCLKTTFSTLHVPPFFSPLLRLHASMRV